MTDRRPQLKIRRAERAEISPKGIGTFIEDFLSTKPRYISARILMHALLSEYELDSNIGTMDDHNSRSGDTLHLSKLHSLTLASLARAEWELHNYRKESLGFPYLHEGQGIHPLMGIVEYKYVTWNDYSKLLIFIFMQFNNASTQ